MVGFAAAGAVVGAAAGAVVGAAAGAIVGFSAAAGAVVGAAAGAVVGAAGAGVPLEQATSANPRTAIKAARMLVNLTLEFTPFRQKTAHTGLGVAGAAASSLLDVRGSRGTTTRR